MIGNLEKKSIQTELFSFMSEIYDWTIGQHTAANSQWKLWLGTDLLPLLTK